METPIKTFIDKNFKLEILQDNDSGSPERWDNFGKLINLRGCGLLEDFSGRDIITAFGNICYSQIPTNDQERYYYIVKKSEGRKEFETKQTIQKYCDYMAEIFGQYFEGDVYGYIVSVNTATKNNPEENWSELDSRWGFYGLELAISEGKSVLESYIAKEIEAEKFEREICKAIIKDSLEILQSKIDHCKAWIKEN